MISLIYFNQLKWACGWELIIINWVAVGCQQYYTTLYCVYMHLSENLLYDLSLVLLWYHQYHHCRTLFKDDRNDSKGIIYKELYEIQGINYTFRSILCYCCFSGIEQISENFHAHTKSSTFSNTNSSISINIVFRVWRYPMIYLV